MIMEEEIVPEEALKVFAERCVLTPSLLARRLDLSEAETQQVLYAYPFDRYEQIYQILMKWRNIQPRATWKQLIEATDSGLRHVLNIMYQKKSGNSDVSEVSRKRSRFDSPEENVEQQTNDEEHKCKQSMDDDVMPTEPKMQPSSSYMSEVPSEPVVHPSAPPFSLIKPPTSGNHSVEDTVLSYECDYAEVLEAVQYETKWYYLGIALKIPAPLLDEIEISHHRQVADCRREMIKKWLQQSGKAKPSWRTLCQALRNSLVGNIGLANRIAEKHQIF